MRSALAVMLCGAVSSMAIAGVDSSGVQQAAAVASLPAHGVVAGTISTVAGGPGSGRALSIAQNPYFLVLSGSNIYESDLVGNVVRLVDLRTSIETPVAGDGYGGFAGDGGPASQSELNQPGGIATDASGDIFVADQDSQRIREIPSSSGTQYGIAMTAGSIYTVAGDGTQGFSGDAGPATQAELALPEGIALDSSGDIYIADTYNGRVREVAATNHTQFGTAMQVGDVYTVAGNGQGGDDAVAGDGGPGAAAEIGTPQGVWSDPSGNIYVTQDLVTTNLAPIPAPVREIAATTGSQFGIAMTGGDIYSVAGGTSAQVCLGSSNPIGDGCVATDATLLDPVDAVTDGSGNLFITDYYHNRVREVAAGSGIISTFAGTGLGGYTGDGGQADKAPLSFPTGLAFDASGNLYVSDSTTIRVIEKATSAIETIAGDHTFTFSGDGGPATDAQFGIATDVVTDESGNLYVPDSQNNVVREVAAITHDQFGISMTAGDIYTIAGDGYGVGGIQSRGGFGGDGGPATQALLSNPTSVAVDVSGDVYISDFGNHRIREISAATGLIATVVGNSSAVYSGEGGPAWQASLSDPNQVTLDASGDLFIEDEGASRVLEVASSYRLQFGIRMSAGNIYTLAGDGKAGFLGDGGPAVSAELDNPSGIAVDAAGDLFIADRYNNRMREVANAPQTRFGVSAVTGGIYTIAGNGSGGGFTSTGDGVPALDASLGSPVGAAVDALGDLWFSDTNGHAVREISASSGIISTVAGNGTAGYLGDGGTGGEAELSSPGALSLDSQGNLYVVDDFLKSGFGYNEVTGRVRKVSVAWGVATAPASPLSVVANPARTSAQVSWLPPASDGGSPVVGYSVAASPGGASATTGTGANTATIKGLSPGSAYTFTVTAMNAVGTSVPSSPSAPVTLSTGPVGKGYWMLDAVGNVYAFGTAPGLGSATGIGTAAAIAPTPDGNGYWVASSNGSVSAFGDAPGIPAPGLPTGTSAPFSVVSIVPTPYGNGYWLAAGSGLVIWEGDAKFYGDAVNIHLNAPIVNMVATPDGDGYWLLAGDGGVFSYGDASFYGSTRDMQLNAPAVAMAATPDGAGYWLVASDGGVFSYGDAQFFGSMGETLLAKPVNGIVATADGEGYWMVAADGGVFSFGDAGFVGSLGGNPPASRIVGFAAS